MLKHRSSPPFGPQVSPFSLAAHPFLGQKPSTYESAPLRSRSPRNVASGRSYRTVSVQAALPARAPTSHPDEPRLLSSDKPVAPRCSPTCNENAGRFTKCASRCHNAFNVDGYTAYQRTERFPSFLRRSAFSLKAVNRRQRTGAVYPLLNGPGRFPFLPGPLLFSDVFRVIGQKVCPVLGVDAGQRPFFIE